MNGHAGSGPGGTATQAIDAIAAVYVVDGDRSITYLLRRYSREAGIDFCPVNDQWPSSAGARQRRVAIWFPSIESLELARPRERGTSDDIPVIVFAYPGGESRARELGADYCAAEPLTFSDFLEALRAVGLPTTGEQAGRARP